MPAEIIEPAQKKKVNAVFADPRLKARLNEVGGAPLVGTPADFGKHIAEETEEAGQGGDVLRRQSQLSSLVARPGNGAYFPHKNSSIAGEKCYGTSSPPFPATCGVGCGAHSRAVSVCAKRLSIRPVKIVVGFAPGGGQDILARMIARWLSEKPGQQFVIENRPGQAGSIARRGRGALAAGRLHALPDRPEQRDQRNAL